MAKPQGDMVVQVSDLGKSYRIYPSPKARLKQAIFRDKRKYYQEFWALRNVSFGVKRGESLGIIGRNGSGKSTLLQLICGTLTATEGSIKTHGKVAALLELGSGFNPEFTGLENIYLNASLLGLSQEETQQRLDNILTFADIGDFIDQPVKTFSSGMTVRLAFAVLAHVNADILVVDEALAVGDAIFVQRCMRFIRRMREERCLLFVSHDAEAVKSLCSHALWLSNGATQSIGPCKRIALEYLRYCQAVTYGEETSITPTGDSSTEDKLSDAESGAASCLAETPSRIAINYEAELVQQDNLKDAKGWLTGHAEMLEVSLSSLNGSLDNNVLKGGEEVEVRIRAIAHKPLANAILGFVLKDRLGQDLFGENTLIVRNKHSVCNVEAGKEFSATFRFWFPMLPNGTYTLMASVADGEMTDNTQHHWVEDATIVVVSSSRVRYGLAGAFFTKVELNINTFQDIQ